MKQRRELPYQLKWAIYDWIGAISVEEFQNNHALSLGIKNLNKKLSQFNLLGAKTR